MTTIDTLTCPDGMYGLAVEPWGANEIYAVAANWAQASSPVMVWGDAVSGWCCDEHGRQVADFRHNSRKALESILRDAVIMGGDDPDDVDIESMLDDAVSIN